MSSKKESFLLRFTRRIGRSDPAYSILLLVLYGPVLATILLALRYYVVSDGKTQEFSTDNSSPNTDGVVLIGVLSGVNPSLSQVSIRWTIGAYGPEYAVSDNASHTPDGYIGWLSRPVNIYFDGEAVKTYEPSQVINRSVRGSNAIQFSSTYNVDGFSGLPSREPLKYQGRSPQYSVTFEAQITDAITNDSLPLANSGIVCFPGFAGWEINGCRLSDMTTTDGAFAYVVGLDIVVDSWKVQNEKELASILVILSCVAFGMTWQNILQIWRRERPRRIMELLSIPTCIAGAAGAVRAVFPPESPMQTFLDESFYYPAIVLLIWCAFVAVLLTSESGVRIYDRLYTWMNRYWGPIPSRENGDADAESKGNPLQADELRFAIDGPHPEFGVPDQSQSASRDDEIDHAAQRSDSGDRASSSEASSSTLITRKDHRARPASEDQDSELEQMV